MNLTKLSFCTAILAVVGLTPSMFGFAEIARGKLTATTKLAYSYDSSIFANNNEVGDYSIIFTPTLSYSRNVGQLSTAVRLSVNSYNFQDTDGQDSIDPSLQLSLNLDRADKGRVSQTFSYTRSSSANESLNTRAESNEVRGATSVDYFFSEKTGFRGNLAYRLSDFLSAGYNSVESYSVGGGVVYKYSPKLTAVATYGYSPEKATDLAANPVSNPSSKNHRFRVGLEGQLAPKLTGNVAIGLVYRDFDLGGDASAFLVNTVLSWAIDPKNSLSLNASNDFDTTPGAESAENTGIALSSRHALSEKLSVGGSYRYQHSVLSQRPGPTERTDESNTFGVNASYRVTDRLNVSGSLSWRDNSSTLARAVYTRNVATIDASYSF